MIELIGFAAATFGTICWVPQSIQAWRTKDTTGLSLSGNLMVLTTLILWLTYGIFHISWPLIMGNAISVGLVLSIIIAKLRYG